MTEPPGRGEDYITGTYGRRTRQALEDFCTFVALGDGLVAQGRTAYDQSIYSRLSAEAVVHRIGGAIASLPPALTSAHPEIKFSLARGMRNRIAHQYHRVDYEILWQALSVDLPRMATQVTELFRTPSK